MKNKLITLLALALLACLTARTRADTITDWNEVLERAIKTNAFNAAIQARAAANTHAAMFDAVNGIAHTYAPYFIREAAPAGANPEAAAAQAAHTALSWLFPNLVTNFDLTLSASLTQVTNSGAQGSAIAQGLSWGASVATRIIAWRAQDGFTNAMPGYFGGTNIGQWRSVPTPTAPDGTLSAIVPQLAVMAPFAMTSPSQFRPGPPYGLPLAEALASAQYATDFDEVKTIGRIDSVTRTAEQTSLARLWQASSTAELNNCLRQVVPGTNSLVDNARLFLLANIVAADGLIAGFDAKYTYNFWRPHHAIRFADLDDNTATEADPAWNALIIAPRHQEYISNHAVHSGGMAYALARLLGDAQTFTLGSVDFPGFTWTFHSFSELRVQVKEARIWGGIHYRHSCDVGEAVGHSIADYVVDNFLRPATALAITQQPQDQTAIAGSNAVFCVSATGTPPLRYQWRSYLNATTFTNIPGATNACLSLNDVQPTSQRFAIVVTDAFGDSMTSAPLARLTVVVPPAIVAQPVSQTVIAGSTVTFSVVVTGLPAPSVQWRFNGADLSGRTGSSRTLANVQPNNSGEYTAFVSNSVGLVFSEPATLVVRVPDLIYRWNQTAISTLGIGLGTFMRGMAMVHVAQFDAVNAVVGGFTPYCTSIVAPNASPEAAAAQAAFAVLTNLAPASLGTLQSALNTSLQSIPNGPAKSAGLALGQTVAGRVILLRASDASTITVPYTPTVVPGLWRPTPPGFEAARTPGWKYVTPWTLTSSTQFRLPPPPPLNSPIYTRDFIETRDFGRASSAFRTPAMTDNANFQGCSSENMHALARAAVLVHPLSLVESARVFALVAMANADDLVADYETRYAYSYWRPITAITEADTDGNPATDKDASWTPQGGTPNFPEYPSGTTSTVGSSVGVLESLFGDEYTFTIQNSCSPNPRTYQRLSDFMADAANGRIWAGAHWRNSCEQGEILGRAVGRHVVANFLRPNPQLVGQPQPGGFQISAPPRRAYDLVLQYSADFVNWLPLTNYTSPDSTWQFLDPAAATDPYRFYRLVQP